MADTDTDGGNPRAMELENQKLQDDEDDEFLDGSHNNKSGAVQPLDRQHNHPHHLGQQQDTSRADDPLSGPASTLAAPPGVAPAAAAAAPAISKAGVPIPFIAFLARPVNFENAADISGQLI